jgi:hypothetical protein
MPARECRRDEDRDLAGRLHDARGFSRRGASTGKPERCPRGSDLDRTARPHSPAARRSFLCPSAAPSRTART